MRWTNGFHEQESANKKISRKEIYSMTKTKHIKIKQRVLLKKVDFAIIIYYEMVQIICTLHNADIRDAILRSNLWIRTP